MQRWTHCILWNITLLWRTSAWIAALVSFMIRVIRGMLAWMIALHIFLGVHALFIVSLWMLANFDLDLRLAGLLILAFFPNVAFTCLFWTRRGLHVLYDLWTQLLHVLDSKLELLEWVTLLLRLSRSSRLKIWLLWSIQWFVPLGTCIFINSTCQTTVWRCARREEWCSVISKVLRWEMSHSLIVVVFIFELDWTATTSSRAHWVRNCFIRQTTRQEERWVRFGCLTLILAFILMLHFVVEQLLLQEETLLIFHVLVVYKFLILTAVGC